MKPRYGRITRQRADEIRAMLHASNAHANLMSDALEAAFKAAASYPEAHAAMTDAVEAVVNKTLARAMVAD